jgi:hypothetical protein
LSTATKTNYLGAYVGKETYEKVEQFRGQVPKSRVIEDAINYYLTAQALGERKNES